MIFRPGNAPTCHPSVRTARLQAMALSGWRSLASVCRSGLVHAVRGHGPSLEAHVRADHRALSGGLGRLGRRHMQVDRPPAAVPVPKHLLGRVAHGSPRGHDYPAHLRQPEPAAVRGLSASRFLKFGTRTGGMGPGSPGPCRSFPACSARAVRMGRQPPSALSMLPPTGIEGFARGPGRRKAGAAPCTTNRPHAGLPAQRHDLRNAALRMGHNRVPAGPGVGAPNPRDARQSPACENMQPAAEPDGDNRAGASGSDASVHPGPWSFTGRAAVPWRDCRSRSGTATR